MILPTSSRIPVILTLAAWAVGCSRSTAPSERPEPEASHQHDGLVRVEPRIAAEQGIVVARAALRALPPVLTVPARVALSQDGLARVVSPVEGRIVEIPKQTGDVVAEGDLLAVLESPEFSAAQLTFLAETRAVAAARGSEALARDSWQRAVDLHAGTGDPPKAELQRREAELLRMEAERIEAEGRMQLARDRLQGWGVGDEELALLFDSGAPKTRYELRSPRAGRLIERAASIGQFAGPQLDSVAAVADLERLWVIASFPESRLRELQLGARAMIYFDSEPGHGCPGEVVFISPVLDLATRTVELRIQPEDRHPDLRPGLFARAEIEIRMAEDRPREGAAVPESSVLRLNGTNAVFVPAPGEPGAYAVRAVRVGRAVRGWMPILEGLLAGEEYVAEGSFLLKAELEEGEAGHGD